MKNRNKKTEEEILAELPGLYQSDPDRFEKLRRELIRLKIESFPAGFRKQAHGIQFQLEGRLRKYKDPVARMNKMVEILWQQFVQFQDVLQNPSRVASAREERKRRTVILPFRSFRTKSSETDN